MNNNTLQIAYVEDLWEKRPERMQKVDSGLSREKSAENDLLYGINENPPWQITLFLGFQHYLMMFGSTMAIPYIVSDALCISNDNPVRGHLVSTIFFVSGIITLLQISFGSRLPIIQGGSFVFLVPIFAIIKAMNIDCTENYQSSIHTDNQTEQWRKGLNEIQGAVISSGIMQLILGYSGAIGILIRFLTPLAIAPTIGLIGLSLAETAANAAGKNWPISLLNVSVPIPVFRKNRKCEIARSRSIQIFSILIAMGFSWIVCAVLTACNLLDLNSQIRTDRRIGLLTNTQWFRVPYPGQFGLPTFHLGATVGMLSTVLASSIESVGDYYSCAKLAGAPPPPLHAINRGIGTEGIGCVIAGFFATGCGTTSYSQNVGAIGLLKVGSRRVFQCCALIMIVFSLFSKFGSFFATLPEPILGGLFFPLFGMVTSIGISYLQFVDLNSSRNLFIIGVSFLGGLGLPHWLLNNEDSIKTDYVVLDQMIKILLMTHMFVGGLIGLILDNTIPGSDEERGLIRWRQHLTAAELTGSGATLRECYDIPFVTKCDWMRHVPFSPTYNPVQLTKIKWWKRVFTVTAKNKPDRASVSSTMNQSTATIVSQL